MTEIFGAKVNPILCALISFAMSLIAVAQTEEAEIAFTSVESIIEILPKDLRLKKSGKWNIPERIRANEIFKQVLGKKVILEARVNSVFSVEGKQARRHRNQKIGVSSKVERESIAGTKADYQLWSFFRAAEVGNLEGVRKNKRLIVSGTVHKIKLGMKRGKLQFVIDLHDAQVDSIR